MSYTLDFYKLPEPVLRQHLSECNRVACQDCRNIVEVLGISVECPECDRIVCVCDMDDTPDSTVSLGLEAR